MTIQTALLQGAEILERAAIPASRLTAEVLLSHALHCERTFLYTHAPDELPERAWIHYGRYLDERLKGKPVQYITRCQEFYGRSFYVDGNVLIPRPETEHLVEAAIKYLDGRTETVVLDVGTGSGAIAISVALETNRIVLASDISVEALTVATRNRRNLNARVSFMVADLLEPVQPASIGLLLSNPPYVPGEDAANMQIEVRDYEPHVALFAGSSGLEIYRRLIAGAERAVEPGGHLMVELGYQSLAGVRELLQPHWTDIDVIADLAGWPRVIHATLRGGLRSDLASG